MEEVCSVKLNQLIQKTMFSVLLIEVSREMKIPITILNSSKFRSFVKFLNASVEMPTIAEVLELNIANSEYFGKREEEEVTPQTMEEQLKLVSEWIQFKTDQEKKIDESITVVSKDWYNRFGRYFSELYKYEGLPRSTTEKMSPEAKPELEAAKGPIVFNALENPEVVEKDMDYEEFKSVLNEEIPEEKPNQLTISAEYEKKVKIEYDELQESSYSSTEMKSLSQNGELYFSNQGTSKKSSPTIDEQFYDEDGHFSAPSNHEYTRKYKSNYKRNSTLTTFEDIPGYVKYPCLVCNQRVESTAVRSVNTSDAFVMIYVCVQNGYYTVERAKEFARMQKFKCCAKHLTSIHDSALHWLGIVDVNIDIHTENPKIVSAYQSIKEIKESRYVQKLVFEGSRKHIIPLCNTLKKFFEKYGRLNWIPKKNEGTSTEKKQLVDEELLHIIRSQ